MYTDFPKYPTAIFNDTDYPNQTDDVNIVYAALVNALKEELQACFDELGLLPKGDFASVSARLLATETATRTRVAAPVSQWKMNDDEATSIVLDAGGKNNGVFTDTSGAINTDTGSVTGKINKGLELDGTDEFINIPNFNGLPSSQISLSAWVKIPTHKNYNRIIGHEWSGVGSWLVYIGSDGKPSFGIVQCGGTSAVKSSLAVSVDVWALITCTYDGVLMKMYINGELTGTTDLDHASLDYIGSIEIGGNLSSPLDGVVDDVRIYDFGLIIGEVEALFKDERGTEERTPLIE